MHSLLANSLLVHYSQFLTSSRRSLKMNVLHAIVVVYMFCATILELRCEPDPLLLTPLIKSGRLDEARNLSKVEPFLDDIKSYAGYFTVNNKTESHLYFWFFPCTNASRQSAPLILWLSGGPGITSMYGLFEENGPFKVANDGVTLQRREYAWTNNYQMLYIDQPVGTGFSFTRNETHGHIKTQEQVAEHLYSALLQFYKLFHEFKSNDLYIGGESDAGKFAPALAIKIHHVDRRVNQTAKRSNPKIPLTGLIIASGFSDPETMIEYGQVLYGLGLIDKNERKELETKQDEVKSMIKSKKWCLAKRKYDALFVSVIHLINGIDMFDYTDFHQQDTIPFIDFVSKNQTRERIHAYFGNQISWMNFKIQAQFAEDMLKPVREWMVRLLDHYRILFFNGNLDIVMSHVLTHNFLEKLHWRGALKYAQAKKQLWSEDGVVAGYYRVADNLVDVLVFNAGHSVPIRQPKNALRLIDMFIGKKFNESHAVHFEVAEQGCISNTKPGQ